MGIRRRKRRSYRDLHRPKRVSIVMNVQSERFGLIEANEQDIVRFPEGILGFPDHHEYVLIRPQDGFFHFLQAVDDPGLAFVVISPELMRPDYQVRLDSDQVGDIKLTAVEEAIVYAIVTVPENVANMTANLQAPLIINHRACLGKQLVLMDGKYQIRHNVLAELQQAAFHKSKTSQHLRKTV